MRIRPAYIIDVALSSFYVNQRHRFHHDAPDVNKLLGCEQAYFNGTNAIAKAEISMGIEYHCFICRQRRGPSFIVTEMPYPKATPMPGGERRERH